MTLKTCVQAVSDFFTNDIKGAMGEVFAQKLHENMKVHDVYVDSEGTPTVIFELYTDAWMRNGHDIVHGGCLATIVDFYTTLALPAEPSYWSNPEKGPKEEEITKVVMEMGVSRALSVQFIQAVPINTTVYVVSKLVSNTKRNIYFTCTIKDKDGRVLVTGTHDKVKVNAPVAKL